MVVIGVLSGKGGVGKTTVTSNLATALSNEFGRKVIVLDTNVSSSHIRLHFGLVDEVSKTLPDVIKGKSDISKAIYKNEITGVNIVPSSAGLNRNLDLEKLKNLAGDLTESEYDFVIIDASPGFGDDVMNAIKAADKIIVVTTPYAPDLSDAMKTIELVRKAGKKVTLVLNRVRKKKYEMDIENVESMLDTRVDTIIPEDDKIPESISRSVPVVVFSKGSKVSIVFKKLAASIIGKKYSPSISDRIKWAFGF